MTASSACTGLMMLAAISSEISTDTPITEKLSVVSSVLPEAMIDAADCFVRLRPIVRQGHDFVDLRAMRPIFRLQFLFDDLSRGVAVVAENRRNEFFIPNFVEFHGRSVGIGDEFRLHVSVGQILHPILVAVVVIFLELLAVFDQLLDRLPDLFHPAFRARSSTTR